MKIKTLVNPQFFNSLRKIINAEIPVSLAWKLKGTVKYLEQQHQAYDDMRKELLTKHGDVDDQGNPKTDETGQVVFKDGAKEKFIAAHKELLEQDIELESKISVADIASIKLTTSDLLVLEDILQE